MKKIVISLILFLTIGVSFAYSQEQAVINQIDKYIEQVQNDWKLPGVSVSIVKGGDLLWAKGYGIKEIGKDTPVDENTVYQVGSISKSFTSTLMAMLVDEGLVSWEDTVKSILPDFQWHDKWVENNMQIKDIMTHHTGLAGQQGTYLPNAGYDREDIYKMFRLLKPTYSFRGAFEYNNITFIIAAKIIEAKTGKSWEENIQERIFDKLGMNSSSVNGEGYEAAGDRASIAHEFFYDSNVEGYIRNEALYGEERALFWETVIGPAGSVNSTVVDLAKYAEFHKNNGKVGDTQIVSEKNMRYLHKGASIVSQNDDAIRLYGQCWYIEQNQRYRVYYHTGTTWGFTGLCAFVPELDLSVSVLVNSESSSNARFAIVRKTIDLFLADSVNTDYSKKWLKEWLANREKSASRDKKSKEILPEVEKKGLVGHYYLNEILGSADITLEDGKLYIKINNTKGWKKELTHVSGTNYSFRSEGHSFPIAFNMNKKGTKALSLEIDFGGDENFGPWLRK